VIEATNNSTFLLTFMPYILIFMLYVTNHTIECEIRDLKILNIDLTKFLK